MPRDHQQRRSKRVTGQAINHTLVVYNDPSSETLLTDWDATGWLYLFYAAAVGSEWQRRVGRVQW